LAATAASAVEYEDIIGLTKEGVSTRTIMELIVKDGRAFEMSDAEMQRLKDENVDPEVVKAMLDPSFAQTWLDGGNTPDNGGGYSSGGGNGYQTSLDQAYGQGYSDGQGSSLVFSFGYYYGPLSRYYYCDPFYYSFWNSGYYGCGYWPSYYASYYRPYYGCGAYPYNYYNGNSYYCNSYYDPGYYRANGYNVAPGGRSVYDNSPRYRDGGLAPGATVDNRAAMANAGRTAGRPSTPPVVGGATRSRDLVANGGRNDGSVSRSVSPSHSSQPSTGATRSGGGSRIDRSGGDVSRGSEASRMTREGRTPRYGSGSSGSNRSWLPNRGSGSNNGVRRVGGSTTRDQQPGGTSRGVRRMDGQGGVANSRRNGGSSYDPGRQTQQRMAPQSYRGAPQSRGNSAQPRGYSGGGEARGNSGGGNMSHGGGGGGGSQIRGGGGGGGGQARSGGGGGGGGGMGHGGHAGGR
jgi:hypothetical protein